MASERLGMNPERVTQQTGIIRSRTVQLDSIAEEIAQTGQASRWPGMFGLIPGNIVMTQGSIWLAEAAAADIRSAAASAEELVARLLAEVQDQLDTSSSGEGYRDGMSRAQADRLFAEAMGDPHALDHKSADQIAFWWSKLSAEQANKLWRSHPDYFGNRDGVPYNIRIGANRLNAIDDLNSGNVSSEEHRQYLEKVQDGSLHLVTYDPENDRLVEALGLVEYDEASGTFNYLAEPPTEVVTYVPGTMTSNETFYGQVAEDGSSLREVPEWLQQKLDGRGERSVVFIYKDGRFPGGTDGDSMPYGLLEANQPGLAERSGVTLSKFQSNLALESVFDYADTTAVGHSWGFANIANSEGSGAHYTTVVSISGAAAPDAWQAQDGTSYSHHSYVDALSVAHDGGFVTGQDPDSIFGKDNTYVYRGPDDLNPWANKVGVLLENHSLSNSTIDQAGNEENQALLWNVLTEIDN